MGVNVASLSVEQEEALSECQAANLLSWHLLSKLEHHFENRLLAIIADGYEYWQPSDHVCTSVVGVKSKLLI